MTAEGHDDFAFEPVRGLPERLPKGERMLWQGEPRWQTLAFQVFHVRLVAVYFALLYAWTTATAMADGAAIGAALGEGLVLVPVAAAAIAVLCGLAWLTGRTSVYTITDRRVVLRIGIALPVTFNLPFEKIGQAGVRRFPSGAGDISLSLAGRDRLAWLHLWPHVRPWRLRRAEPMLRAVPHVDRVAEILGRALVAYHGGRAVMPTGPDSRRFDAGAVATAAE